MITFTTTASSVLTPNVLVYGPSGCGKTTLISTLKKPVIVSSEKGTMSIAEHGYPVIEIDTVEDFREAYKFIKKNLSKFDEVCIDSASDIAESCLADKKAHAKDPRKAFYDTQEIIMDILRKFRDLKIRTYVVARHDVFIDAAGIRSNGPSMPSKAMSNDLPYIYDIVMAMQVVDTGKKIERQLLTELTPTWYAKDRSRSLDTIEKPDLGAIFDKIATSLENSNGKRGKGKKGKKGKKQ